ncbi:MAG TPA: S8 family serine peptidase [Verrucomicrobiota bacterium]|nr:S8 family serine peptidase [Verrucomicrobiota bacterium]
MKRILLSIVLITTTLAVALPTSAAPPNRMIGINIVLNRDITDQILADLSKYGRVTDAIPQLNAVTIRAKASLLPSIQDLPYVAAANPDAERYGAPIDTVAVSDFSDGLSTWNLDAINVTDVGFNNRRVGYDGSGVYVAVLDTGLLDSWRQYFPQERIATEYAICFGGGGGDMGFVSTQPNKWEHDQNSHGTHVTSTIIGYSLRGTRINGVAPKATVIPVKVLNQNGSGWSSVIAKGITYVADLKAGPLAACPVVINMSLGGPALDAAEKAAIDYAISKGVIIVASAGNGGAAGMGYPGAYAPVISVAACGWVGEWSSGSWWYSVDVGDPTEPADFYITDFSSRQKAGQDLDVAAPGSWIVGPYQLQSGKISYYFLGGTSMAAPHVTGIVALMAQKHPALTAAQAESILEDSAIYLAPGSRTVYTPYGITTISWDTDATGAGLVDAAAALDATP